MFYKIIFTILGVFCLNFGYSQHVTRHFMENLPQRGITDLTYIPDYNYAASIPFISHFNIDFKNDFSINDIGSHQMGDSTFYVNPDIFLNNLNNISTISLETDIEIISSSWKSKDIFYSFTIKNKTIVEARYPKDFLILGWRGNSEFIGKNAVFSGSGIDFVQYNEVGLSATRIFFEKFVFGARLKYIQGLSNVSFEKNTITLKTDTTTYWLTGRADYRVNISQPLDTNGFDNFYPSNYIFNFHNPGFGVDLGVKFNMTEKINFSLNALDLGTIRWKSDVKNYSSENASFTFEGFKIDSTMAFPPTDSSINIFADSITSIFEPNETEEYYSTGINPKLYLTASYNLNKNNKFGLAFYQKFNKYKDYTQLSLLYNKKFGDILNVGLSYSFTNRNYNKVGAGLSLKIGMFNLYFLSDDVLSYFYPLDAHTINFQFGINFVRMKVKETPPPEE